MEKLNIHHEQENIMAADSPRSEVKNPSENERAYFGKTKDGADVYDRADGSHFHSEGGLTPELLQAAIGTIDTEGKNFIKRQVNFDRQIGSQTCVDVGPEDEIVMVYRKNRSGQTPMVKNREMKPCSSLVTILKRNRSIGVNAYELITGYIGEESPREPWDPNLETEEERQKCEDFWHTHALIYDENLIDWEKTKAFEFMSEPARNAELIRQKVVYAGLFVDPGDLHEKAQPTLEREIEYPHVTTSFKPNIDQLHLDQIGEKAKIYAVGYGNDEKNEGLLVRIMSDDPVLQEACDKIETPHITLSISNKGQAKNTAFLDFTMLDEPFMVEGRYGLFSQGKVIADRKEL